MKKLIITIIIGLFLLTSFGFASAIFIPVPSPHAFYGSVNYSNGQSLEGGTIIAQINNLTVGSCDITDGFYDLVVESEYGGLIYFYLDGEDKPLETFIFEAFEITELNLIVKNQESFQQNETPKIEKTSHKATIRIIPSACEPNWKCSGWSCIDDDIMTRNCKDTNHCEYSYNKPIERTVCETNSILEEESTGQESILFKSLYEPKNLLVMINWILVIGIIFFLILIIFLRKR